MSKQIDELKGKKTMWSLWCAVVFFPKCFIFDLLRKFEKKKKKSDSFSEWKRGVRVCVCVGANSRKEQESIDFFIHRHRITDVLACFHKCIYVCVRVNYGEIFRIFLMRAAFSAYQNWFHVCVCVNLINRMINTENSEFRTFSHLYMILRLPLVRDSDEKREWHRAKRREWKSESELCLWQNHRCFLFVRFDSILFESICLPCVFYLTHVLWLLSSCGVCVCTSISIHLFTLLSQSRGIQSARVRFNAC